MDYIASPENEYIAFDIETNSPEEHLARVIGLAVTAFKDQGVYLTLAKWGEKDVLRPVYSELEEKEIVSKVCKALLQKKLIMHNGIYDILTMLHSYGIDLAPALYCDTILLKHTLDEERPFGLKDLGVRYFGEDADEEQRDLAVSVKQNGGKWTKYNKDIYKGDPELIGKYAAKDVALTMALFELLSKQLKQEKLENFFYNQEVMPLYKSVTIPMKYTGIHIDVEYFKSLKKEIEDGIIKLTEQVYELIDKHIQPKIKQIVDDKVKPTRTGRFAQKVLEYYSLPVPLNKKTGKPTLVKKELKALLEAYPDHPALLWLLYSPKTETKEVEEIESDIDPITGEEVTTVVKKLVAVELPDPDAPKLSEQVELSIKKELYVERYPKFPHIFNLSSSQHLSWLLFDQLKQKPKSYSRITGAPQVDKDSLEEYSELDFIPILAKLKKEEKLLSTYVIPILEKEHHGKLYPSMLQFGTTSGRYSCAGGLNLQTLPRDDKRIKKGFIAPKGYKVVNADFCLHPKTEYLTQRGWVPVLNLEADDLVWQVNKDSLEGSWCKPLRIIKRKFTGKMYKFGNRRGNLEVTENHTMLYGGQYHGSRPDKLKFRKVLLSQDLIPTQGLNLIGASTSAATHSCYSKEEIWKACALQADGSLQYKDKDDCYRIQVSLPRKREKLNELFGKGKEAEDIRPGHTLITETWSTLYFKTTLLSGKRLNVDLIGSNQVEEFLRALAFFDGSVTKNGTIQWGSVDKKQVELVQAMLVRHGYEARLRTKQHNNTNHKDYYHLHITSTPRFRLRPQDVVVSYYSGMVGCVTVPEGFILVRSEGQVFVTGNCALEPRVFSWVSNDPGLKRVWQEGLDLYSQIAIDVFGLKDVSARESDANYLKNVDPEKRQIVKAFALATVYGANAWRIASLLKIPPKEAQDIINRYLEAYPGLRDYMIDQEDFAKTNGFVYTEFGRIRHLPEAKNLYERYGDKLNSKLQMATEFMPHTKMDLIYEYNEIRRGRSAEKKARASKLKADIERYGQEGIEIYYKYRNLMNNAKNAPIQATAAHICNMAMIKLATNFKKNKIKGNIVLTIHDEICCIVDERQADNAAKLLKDSMENNVITNQIDIPILAEPIIADTFADAK